MNALRFLKYGSLCCLALLGFGSLFAQTAPAAAGSAGGTNLPAGLKARFHTSGKNTYATSAVRFTLSAVDTTTKVDYIEFRIDNGPWQRYLRPLQVLEEGPRTVYYRSIDVAGNREKENTLELVIDNSPPVVTLSSSPFSFTRGSENFISSKTLLALRANDTYSGVKSLEFALDETPFAPYRNPIQVAKEGPFRLRYRATDNLDNMTAELVFRGVVDNTPPTVSIRTITPLGDFQGKKFSKKDNVFTIEAQDAASGVSRILVKLNDENDFREYSQPITFISAGEKTIEAKAVDRVGNESAPFRIELIIDDTPPTAKIVPATE